MRNSATSQRPREIFWRLLMLEPYNHLGVRFVMKTRRPLAITSPGGRKGGCLIIITSKRMLTARKNRRRFRGH
ncbi:MAG: hypothetical protein C4570_08305 [Ammonifex sp.]|nr:MAG: hypothetical protein C4570_08305 [Ammonifex sp.]